MKFFKKLSNTNSSSSGPKLPFLKTNKKDKSTKTQVETSTPEQTEDWLDLNLPSDFSSSLNIPDFENNHSQEQNDNNATLNTHTDAPETLKTDFSGHQQHVLDKKQTTIILDQPLWTGNQRGLDSKKDETVDTPLPSLSLSAKQEDFSITEVNGTQNKPVEILGRKSEDCDWNESSPENSHGYGEIRKEKERECHEKTEIQSSEEEIKTDTKTSLLQTQDLKEKNNQADTKEEIALLSNSADTTTTTTNSYVQSEIVQTESNQYTPQSQLGTELSTSHEQEDKDKNKPENSTERKNNKVHSEIKSPSANRKKGVDKRLSAQSFIPRKQVIKEEDEKKPEIKDRKRQQTNGYANTTSSMPILSSGAANNNKLIITTTVVLDSNEYYYVPATNSSPSSTTSTSTTITNTSANSNTKTQKQKTQQHSKIPVASNLTLSASSSTSRACSSQATQHPISRLPKKINKT